MPLDDVHKALGEIRLEEVAFDRTALETDAFDMKDPRIEAFVQLLPTGTVTVADINATLRSPQFAEQLSRYPGQTRGNFVATLRRFLFESIGMEVSRLVANVDPNAEHIQTVAGFTEQAVTGILRDWRLERDAAKSESPQPEVVHTPTPTDVYVPQFFYKTRPELMRRVESRTAQLQQMEGTPQLAILGERQRELVRNAEQERDVLLECIRQLQANQGSIVPAEAMVREVRSMLSTMDQATADRLTERFIVYLAGFQGAEEVMRTELYQRSGPDARESMATERMEQLFDEWMAICGIKPAH